MTEQRRWLLFFLLTFIVIQIFTLLSPPPPRQTQTQGSSADGQTTGTLTNAVTTGTQAAQTQTPAAGQTVEGTSATLAQRPGTLTTVRTDNYAITFDSVGAVIRSLSLLDPGSASFKKSADSPTTGIELVRTLPTGDPNQVRPLEITLATQGFGRSLFEQFNFVEWETRVVQEGGKDRDAIIQFDSPTVGGLRLQKTLTIPYDSYFPTLRITVFNESGSPVTIREAAPDGNRGLGLRWGPGLYEREPGEAAEAEAVYDTALARIDGDVEVLRPTLGKEELRLTGNIEWAGLESKFFAALMVPSQPDAADKRAPHHFAARVPAHHAAKVDGYTPPMVVELASPEFSVAPGASHTLEYGLYIGPKKYGVLESYGHALQTAMFAESWDFMRAIYLGLTDFLNFLYRFAGNYGLAIILLTMIVRLLVFPLTQKQIKIQAKTMAEMAKVKPHLDAINEKYKDDPQERNRLIWEVYKEHNISPFAPLRGCLPLFLQMPIFIGLYRVTNDTIDLQGAGFLWIRDLSQPDHLFYLGVNLPFLGPWFNLLPIIMGVTQVIATWVGMKRASNMDPTQKQMMYLMPIFLTVFLYRLPAGLMVYWCTSNTWQIFQTMITNRMMEREEAKHKAATGTGPSSSAAGGSTAAEFEAQQDRKKK